MDEGRVIRDTIHVERDSGEFQVKGIMVPFIIADLHQTAEEEMSERQKEKGHGEDANASSPAQASREISQALHFPAMASRGKQSGSHAQPESNESSHPLPGTSTRSYVSCLRAVSLARAQKHTPACTTGTLHWLLPEKVTPEEAVFPCPDPAQEHKRFPPTGTIPSNKLEALGRSVPTPGKVSHHSALCCRSLSPLPACLCQGPRHASSIQTG